MSIRTGDLRNGVLASLAATVVLSAIMVMKQIAGMVPMLGLVVPAMALMLHLVNGAVLGLAFGKLSAR